MSNPKFLNVEKKVPYNIRLPQRLIDKYNALKMFLVNI